MPNDVERFVAAMATLNERNQQLRSVLERFESACRRLTELVEQGDSMTGALDKVKGSLQRRDVQEANEGFDSARHAIRLAMFALALEQGATLADMGRALGISRQLASRLGAELER
jgi:hypothetical protein